MKKNLNSIVNFSWLGKIGCLTMLMILACQTIIYSQEPCELSLEQLNASDFRSSLVVNGEPNRLANGNPVEPYATMAKPTQIAFMPGNSRDVFFNEIYKGTINKWDTENQTKTTLIDLDLYTTGERGLTGFAFHPDFEENHWVFVVYNEENSQLKLSRFEYDLNSNKLVNEKVLIQHNIKTPLHHYGNGQLAITDDGVLFMGIGSDADYAGNNLYGNNLDLNGEATAGNTNTISSSILRIVPDSSERGYSIPEGNFGEYFENYFRDQGNDALADEYQTKVKPEIFAKGIRTNFSATVHPIKGWLAWGEVNTDNRWDEYNIVNKPMYSGYPYFHSDNVPLGGTNPNQNANPNEPIPNNSQYNTGVSMLPPAQAQTLPPLAAGVTTSATAGDIYNFDSHNGDGRFPKAFDQHFLMFDFEKTQPHMFASLLEEDGDDIKVGEQKDLSRFLDNVFMRYTLDAEFSPDGELFILNVGDRGYEDCRQCGSIDKVVYTGAQCPQTVSVAKKVDKKFFRRTGNLLLSLSAKALRVEFYTMGGKLIFETTLSPNSKLELNKVIPVGSGEMLIMKIGHSGNFISQKILRIH